MLLCVHSWSLILNVNCVFPPCLCLQAVHTLIALQRRYLTSLGKLSPAEEDSIWQVIIGQRAKVSLCFGDENFRTNPPVSFSVNLLIAML